MAVCVICSKSYEPQLTKGPFCSKRCQDVDLGRWFRGGYAIASEEPPDEIELEIARRKLLDD
jgi:endogenous inhibitor of DNA gyrase (YacG/DUF329 family)